MIYQCPQCHARYEAEEDAMPRFCPNCGAPLEQETSQEQPEFKKTSESLNNSEKTVNEGASSRYDTSSSSDTKICPFCGKTIKRAATVCRFCSNSLSQLVVMCKECGSFIKFAPEKFGKKMTCPVCGELLLVEPAKDRACPSCGETVKFEAKVCKFCHAALPSLNIIDPLGTRNGKSAPLSGGGVLPVSDLWLKDKMSMLWKNLKIWAIILNVSLVFAFFLFPLLLTVVALAFYCIYFYQLMECYWRYVGPEKGYTSGQMAGFCFIPFFNLYWIFVCYGKLVRKVNQANANAVNESYATMYCISFILCSILFIGPILNIIMFFILHSQLNQAFVGEQQ